MLCLIRAVLPRSRSLCANRCSHLSNSSQACFCSDSGHFVRPWRSKTSKTHPFGARYFVSAAVLVGWTTCGTWLAGTICPVIVLAGTSMAQALKLHRQTGTLEEPGCSSPWVAVDTTAAGNWGPSASSVRTCTHVQCPLTLVLAHTLMVPNDGMVTFCLV